MAEVSRLVDTQAIATILEWAVHSSSAISFPRRGGLAKPASCQTSGILMQTTLDYSDALRLIKAGNPMRRAEWRPNKWVILATPEQSLSYLEMVLSDGRRAPYTPSRCDQFIDDWIDGSDLAG